MLFGDAGLIRLDLGNGLQCCAEITAWSLRMSRDRLETTRQGDESRTYAAGLKGHSGTINYNIRLADDAGLFTAKQLIPVILLTEAAAEVPAEFYLQAVKPMAACEPGLERGLVWLEGKILLDDTTIDVAGAPELIRGASAFTVTGELQWRVAPIS